MWKLISQFLKKKKEKIWLLRKPVVKWGKKYHLPYNSSINFTSESTFEFLLIINISRKISTCWRITCIKKKKICVHRMSLSILLIIYSE